MVPFDYIKVGDSIKCNDGENMFAILVLDVNYENESIRWKFIREHPLNRRLEQSEFDFGEDFGWWSIKDSSVYNKLWHEPKHSESILLEI